MDLSPLARDLLARLRTLPGAGSVTLRRLGAVARLELAQPARRNALSAPMIVGLADAVQELHDGCDGLVGLILVGAEGYFCAGADFDLVTAHLATRADGVAISELMHTVTTTLADLPLVSVAVIEGGAVGGGAELATAADLRVIAQGATVRFVHTRLGLVPGWGGGTRVVRLVGAARGLQLLGAAVALDADEALSWGLADRVAGSGLAEAEAERLLAPFLEGVPAAVRAAKAVVVAARSLPRDEALAAERILFGGRWKSTENREALRQAGRG